MESVETGGVAKTLALLTTGQRCMIRRAIREVPQDTTAQVICQQAEHYGVPVEVIRAIVLRA
jgi:hypothetical protein